MKRFLKYTSLTLTLLCVIACQRNQKQVNGNAKKPIFFSTPEEAATKAKSDLLSILRSGKATNLGVDEAALEKSRPARLVRHYQITFEQLLSADSAAAFGKVAQNEMATVVPFVSDNSVVTIAEIARDSKGWRVTSLVDQSVSNDLNALRTVTGEVSEGEITIYDLPHSPVKVYGMKKDKAEMFYSDYPGLDLREGVSGERLLQAVKKDAAEFQQIYGPVLKDQKLVN
jgi:hypothetical protein